MYRVPSLPRYRVIRILKIGIACLLAVPSLAFNALVLWSQLLVEYEQPLRQIRRAEPMTALIFLILAIIGIGASCMLVYALIKAWPRRICMALVAIIITTAMFHVLWYFYAVDVMY
jgi:hypothetical protein